MPTTPTRCFNLNLPATRGDHGANRLRRFAPGATRHVARLEHDVRLPSTASLGQAPIVPPPRRASERQTPIRCASCEFGLCFGRWRWKQGAQFWRDCEAGHWKGEDFRPNRNQRGSPDRRREAIQKRKLLCAAVSSGRTLLANPIENLRNFTFTERSGRVRNGDGGGGIGIGRSPSLKPLL
jgi:hypothetical protein